MKLLTEMTDDELGMKLQGEAPVAFGLCWCGCGKETKIATATYLKPGKIMKVKGFPQKFLPHHHKPSHWKF